MIKCLIAEFYEGVMKKGKVFLVGAGPGDIGLLTVKGMKCLQRADVVVYDFHLNAQVLNYINHNAEFIYAGKRGGHHTMTQDEINRTLVLKAKEGKVICRLKGGDPFVFGRGGEEAEELVKEGIEFEVVPGVSSSVAAPAYAGIPLTHRLLSSSFAVIPGYEDVTKKESAIDWAKLSTGVGTLVFLMAVKEYRSDNGKINRKWQASGYTGCGHKMGHETRSKDHSQHLKRYCRSGKGKGY